MQIPASDADFYQRKIFRLEKDIASLNQELNVARLRLRSAEDFQIKYQLLLRQSQQDSMRAKKMQEAQRVQIAQMMAIEIEQINSQWKQKIAQIEQTLRDQQKEEKERLRTKIEELEKKNKQMAEKSQQMDMLLFKNKKIAKDLESLEQIIEQNRKNNERQREDEVKACKQSLTKKFNERILHQKQIHEQAIKKHEERYEKLELELLRLQIINKETGPSTTKGLEFDKSIQEQLDQLNLRLKEKDKNIQRLQVEKIQQQERHQGELKYLKTYQKGLEEQIFELHSSHQVEIINFRARMEEIRVQELKEKQRECEVVEKQHLKDIQLFNQKILKQKAQLEHIRKIEEAEIQKLKEDKQRLLKKIASLKQRLKEFETNQEQGETQLMLRSFKNIDNKEDEMNSYEDGVTFLERQLKKTMIKLEKKNAEVKELVTKMNHLSEQFQRELDETKQKQGSTISEQKYKIQSLEQEIKELNEQLRRKDKEIRDQDAEYTKKINQVNAENRSLINMNNDLQRDYNRILESKKIIEKSFREERERSITSKSEIAVAKKNKWLELERQKNEIQIIYKQKQEQLKTHYQILLSQQRTQYDKIKSEKQLLQHELLLLKQKAKNSDGKPEGKQNLYSEYQKKLATANLEIALSQNLYSALMKAKSRVKKSTDHNQKQAQAQSEARKQVPSLSLKKAEFQNHLNKIDEKGYGSFERSIKEIEKLSENQSRHQETSREFIQAQNDQHPLTFDDSDEGGVSPTFQMLHSFNPRST